MRNSLMGSLPALLLIGLGATGCKSSPKMDITLFPGGMIRSSGGNVETVEGTVFKMQQVTPTGPITVSQFFHKQLVEELGWTEKKVQTPYLVGTLFADGNFKGEDQNLFEFRDGDAPADPSKPAGQVFVWEKGDTRIRIWRYLPKPR